MRKATAAERDQGPALRPRAGLWVPLWFAALMTLTLAVRIFDPTGWLGSDDAFYHSAAEHIVAAEKIQRVHHHYARMAVVVPTALSIRVFGDSPAAVALPMTIASVLCVALVVVLGRLVWGWWEGLFAATVVSVLPYFRVLSTTAYPDVHACLWATCAIVFAVLMGRERRLLRIAAFGIACGLAAGLASSAKVFSVTVGIGIFAIVWSQSEHNRRTLPAKLSFVALGGLLYVLADGLFYLWAADDFWFKLNALLNVQGDEAIFAGGSAAGLAEAAWSRLTMLFHPHLSGWGKVAVLFWPAALLVLLFNQRGRGIAVWAIAAYLVIALTPVRLKHGLELFPTFHGRHVLVACIPFALCLAWTVRRAAYALVCHRHLGGPKELKWVARGWPIAFTAIAALAYANPKELNGFRDRPTSRVGHAIERIITSTAWDRDREIFMPASFYLRYRILFPPQLRSRLRVAVDDASPPWWRDASVDIASRCKSLPSSEDAYLLTTPLQLRGEAEFWDYGVRLPVGELKAWASTPRLAAVARFKDKTIALTAGDRADAEPLVVLLGGAATVTQESKGDRDDADVG